MQPTPEEFAEWRKLPVSEWIFALVEKFAKEQKQRWANMAWDGELSEILLTEAKVRADAYLALSQTQLEDWIAIDDAKD